MNKFFYPTFIAVLFLFFYAKYYFDENSQADRISNKVIARSGARLEKKHRISVSAIGGGGNSKGLRLLSISFDHRGKRYTKEEARKLLIDLSQEFLKDINEDTDLRPYLITFPFTPLNIDVTVFFYDSEGETIFDPYFCTVSASHGELSYFTESPEDLYQYKTKSYETYEEALAIVNNEK